MSRNASLGAQLIKSITFEVEATPQNNAIEIKNTSNMTPLNVKVKVRKKDDGPSFVRKGIIAIPRLDHPDSPVERLRLASSDQTIMSFNMLMEADLEKKVPKKSKRSFFGICLGLQGDDEDDVQYLPSASTLDKDSKSDSGVVKLKNSRTIDRPGAADDTSSSFSSRKNYKIFGKCKPGGCLDPPFGEDKYAYQPQPLRHKTPATTMDDIDMQGLDMPERSSNNNIILGNKKKKKIEVTAAKVIDGQDDNQDKSILSLYQGEAGTAVEENNSDLIITYPPGLSSSGLLLSEEKNEKNVARRTSGARHSRKTFNEFSTEYFSPPRTPRDSKDSSKSDKGRLTLTKEILAPSQPKSDSPTVFQRTIDKSDSKDLGSLGIESNTNLKFGTENEFRSNINTDISLVPGDSGNALAKETLRRTASSQGITAKLLNELQNKPDKESRNRAATDGLAGVGAATAGLVGLGVTIGKTKDTGKPEERKDRQILEDTATRDSNMERPDLGFAEKDCHLKLTESVSSGNTGKAGTLRIANIVSSESETETKTPIRADIIVSSQERVTLGTGSEKNISPEENVIFEGTKRDLVFNGVGMKESSERRFSQVERPIHDDTYKHIASRGMATTEGSEIGILHPTQEGLVGDTRMATAGGSEGLLHSIRPTSKGTDSKLTSKGIIETNGSERELSRSGKSEDIESNLSPRGMATADDSERGVLRTGLSKNESSFGDLSFKEMATTGGSEGFSHTGRSANIGIDGDFSSRGMVTTDGSERFMLRSGRSRSEDMDGDFLSQGVATTDDTESGLLSTSKPTSEEKDTDFSSRGLAKADDSKRGLISTDRSAIEGIDDEISFRETVTVHGSEKGLLNPKRRTIKVSDGDLASKGIEFIEDSEGVFSMGRSIDDGQNLNFSSRRKSASSAGSFPHTERAIYEGTDAGLTSKGMIMTEFSGRGSQQIESGMYKRTSDFPFPLKGNSEISYPRIEVAAYNDSPENPLARDNIEDSERAFLPVRKAMSEGMERDVISRGKSLSGGSEKGVFPIGTHVGIEGDVSSKGTIIGESERRFPEMENKSTEGDHASKDIDFSKRSDRDVTPSEIGINESFEKNISTTGSTGKRDNSLKRGALPTESKKTSKDSSAIWPKKRDTSVSSDIYRSPSDIISEYRDNKPLVRSPVIGFDIQPTNEILEQAGRKLGGRGSDKSKKQQVASYVGISSYDSIGGVHTESLDITKRGSHTSSIGYDNKFQNRILSANMSESSTERRKNLSRDSIFLNLAFQTYKEENQSAIKTLDSTKDQDTNNVILIKSLLKSQNKRGISVLIDSKHVMNIEIKPAPVQELKSQIPKPISKFDSGKSDQSNSILSLKDIGSDPHTALSIVFHQELVPLESIIKSLKEDIDSLAAQQMMLTDRLGQSTSRPRSAYNRKCSCIKRLSSMRME